MIDKEKVAKGLECCSIPEGHCENCPYETEGYVAECTSALATDALVLQKEQESEIRQLRLALDIVKGTCKGIVIT